MITSTEERISTNKLLLDIIDFDKSLFDKSTLSSDEIRYFNSITSGFDKQIQFYIDWLDSDEARRIFYENESYNEKVFEKIDEEIKSIVSDTSLEADEIISCIYDSGLQHGADEIRRTKYYNDATKFGLHFLQTYNFDLISNVNEDLKNHIRAEIFTGIAASESMQEVAKRILEATNHSLTGKTLSARQRAMMIARTETARAMTQGRLQSYANYGVQEVKILTAGDSSVCAICREAEAKIFPISEAGNLVPFHPLCRCSVMAYIRHGILQGKPDKYAQVIDCTPNNVYSSYLNSKHPFNNMRFNEDSHSRYFRKHRTNLEEIKDNVSVELYPDGTFYMRTGKDAEKFRKYKFKDGITIYESMGSNLEDVWYIKEAIELLPNVLRKNIDTIVLSNQSFKFKNKPGHAYGYVSPDSNDNRIIFNNNHISDKIGTLVHESVHLLEYKQNYYISNSKEYIEACINDSKDRKKSGDTVYINDGTEDFLKYVNDGDEDAISRPLSEDLAYSVEAYLENPKDFQNNFPGRCEIIEKIIKGTFEPTKLNKLPIEEIINNCM